MALDPSQSQFGDDPNAIKRAYALRLLTEGTDTSPIRSWTQGAARLAQALTGGYMANQDLQQRQGAMASLSSLLGGSSPQAANAAPSAVQDAMLPNAPSGNVQDASLPRGMRNNNPGNIEDGTFAQSLPGYAGTDGRFAKFESLDAGMAAMDKLLQNYGSKGLNTVGGIINRWAPPSDNNPTSAYAANVAQKLGTDPNSPINVNDPGVRQKLAMAIGGFENGPKFAAAQPTQVASLGQPWAAPSAPPPQQPPVAPPPSPSIPPSALSPQPLAQQGAPLGAPPQAPPPQASLGMQPGAPAPALPPAAPVAPPPQVAAAQPQAAPQQADIKSKIAQLLASDNPYAQQLGQRLAMQVIAPQLQTPQFTTIGTDKYGNPVHGFVNPATQTTTPAGVMAGQQIGQGGQIPNAAGNEGIVHGADFLKTLAPAEADQVKALAEGRMAFPAGFALKSPYWQRMITNVSQYDPSFDAVNYNARSKTRNDFTSGKSAQSINALNTVIGHLETLSDAADKLNNTNYPSVNSVTNWIASQTGDPRIKQFDATKKAVVDELTRVYRGAGGSEGDIKMWSDQINAANSPDQLHGVIGQVGDLLKSKMDALGEQYKQGMGTTEVPIRLTTPKAEKALEVLRARAGGQQPSAQSAPQSGGIIRYDAQGNRIQ
jgi:hypothetical protein